MVAGLASLCRPLQEILVKYLFIVLLMATGDVIAQPRQPSVLVWDIDHDVMIMGQNTNSTRPIASITKVMTAMVALSHDWNLDRKIPVGAASHLGAGRHSRRDVITAMLVRSDNEASEALARDYPGGPDAFVRVMNRRARDMGLDHTRFRDASGLHAGNIATAGEVATLMVESLKYPIIRETSVQRQAMFEHSRGGKIRQILLPNTNRPLLYEFDSIIASKTGFTRVAGWCVGLVVQRADRQVVIVVLGADSKQQRLDITRELVYNQLRDAEVDQRRVNAETQTPTTWWDRIMAWMKW
jgi:D-alanyl-D-alanine endopeptidase (penicillin-binding protein 7)